jgi:hypothetical protein
VVLLKKAKRQRLPQQETHMVEIFQYTHTLVRAHQKTNNQIKAHTVKPSQVLRVMAVDASVGTNRLQ